MFKKGFTLIELLVVIAIIAILAAILFPVFAQAREKARQASCLSNTKQIGTALQLYVDDYDETLPIALWNTVEVRVGGGPWEYYNTFSWDGVGGNNAGTAQWGTWMDSIWPYVKNINIFACPSGKKNTDSAVKGKNVAGYGYNVYCAGGPGKMFASTASPICLSEINSPSELVFCGDGWQMVENASKGPALDVALFPFMANNGGANSKDNTSRHNGGANFTFCDGHAKYNKMFAGMLENMNGYGDYNRYWNPAAQ